MHWLQQKQQLQKDFNRYIAALSARKPRPIALIRQLNRLEAEISTANEQELSMYLKWWETVRPAWCNPIPQKTEE